MLISFILTFILLVFIDTLYLSSPYISQFYKTSFGPIMRENIHILSALLTWLLIVFSIYFFVNRHSVSYKQSAIEGALLGLSLYGVYNLTNYATLTQWSIELGFRDTLWGLIVVSIMSIFMRFVTVTMDN